MLQNKSILLIISGGIAAYKSLELIRLLKKSGTTVRCILTHGGAQFVTPLSVSALTENPVYTDLWSLKDESEMGHIRLSRDADLIVVAPASANILARIAYGMADDLAAATLLAADKPIMLCPAMNPMMWGNKATQENIATLRRRGFLILEPASGEMACGETGEGRLPEAAEILAAIEKTLHTRMSPPEKISSSVQIPDEETPDTRLKGFTALVTSGPTYEPLDPVRFIGNRSSGKQGHAIAAALAQSGANVILVSGPTALPDPANCKTIRVQTATEMLAACRQSLPIDIAICAAAVADWAPQNYQSSKMKKSKAEDTASIPLVKNPDILATLAAPGDNRPRLVIGFAAETDNLLQNAAEKRTTKGCDWLLANEISDTNPAFDADTNEIHFITANGAENWPHLSKSDIAQHLANRIGHYFAPSVPKAAE